jgi:diphthine-ammonia ligase
VRQLWETRTTNAIVDFVIVPALPRGSQIEWTVWAHSKNRQFECENENISLMMFKLLLSNFSFVDEETGCHLGDESNSPRASIRSRWNYDSTVAAVVCYVEGTQDSASLCRAVDYALGKLLRDAPANSALSMRAFYRTGSLLTAELCAALESAREDLARQGYFLGCTLIPVCALHDQNTVLSLCGLRYQ